MSDGVCKKCGWRAPAGLLKCPFCKTYIREPGAGSSSEERSKPALRPEPPPQDPALPPPDPALVRRVQRELARELFDDSDQWPAFETDDPALRPSVPPAAPRLNVDEETDPSAH